MNDEYKELYLQSIKEMEELIDRYYELSTRFHALSKELESVTLQGFGALFHFKDGTGAFVPAFQDPKEVLSKFDERPIRFVINFDEDTLATWIRDCAALVERKDNESTKPRID